MVDKVETRPLSGGRFVIYTMPEEERSSFSHEYPAVISEVQDNGLAHLQVFTKDSVQTRHGVALDPDGAGGTYREYPAPAAAAPAAPAA
jgi:hypothetical protein